MKKEKVGQDIGQWEEAEKRYRKMHHDRITVMKLNVCESSDDCECMNGVLTEVRPVMKCKKDGLKLKKPCRRLEAKENITEGTGKGCNDKR